MKYIKKGPEPQKLANWKNSDRRPQNVEDWTWKSGRSIRTDLRKTLMKEQGYICCYCERELVEGDCHIEHFRPKDKDLYPELMYEYNNLFCSCQKDLEEGEPLHCGNSKYNWFDEQLMISPLDPECEDKFEYFHDGTIQAKDGNEAAIKTLEKLQLGNEKLSALRKKAIEPFIDEDISAEEQKKFVEYYLKKKDGKFNPFYTTIKHLIET